MGFSGFGKVQKQAKKFDLDAIFEKTKREAKTILSHNGTDCILHMTRACTTDTNTTQTHYTNTLTIASCYHHVTAPASDENSKDDDDMMIGPPVSLAQPDESATTDQQVNHPLNDMDQF